MAKRKKCIYQHPLYSHPLVDGKAMSHEVGQVCLNPSFHPKAILTRENCDCELYSTESQVGTAACGVTKQKGNIK